MKTFRFGTGLRIFFMICSTLVLWFSAGGWQSGCAVCKLRGSCGHLPGVPLRVLRDDRSWVQLDGTSWMEHPCILGKSRSEPPSPTIFLSMSCIQGLWVGGVYCTPPCAQSLTPPVFTNSCVLAGLAVSRQI